MDPKRSSQIFHSIKSIKEIKLNVVYYNIIFGTRTQTQFMKIVDELK